MDDEKLAEQEAATQFEEEEELEYDLEEMETADLDDAMREALEAVERSQEHLGEGAEEPDESQAGEPAAAEPGGDLAVLRAELDDLRDRSVRTLADFDNYRKRVARERRDERRYAAADLAVDILSVLDNLERALESEGSAEDLKQGVEMIQRQLIATLGRHGIQRVEALGAPFDPALHEAVMRIEEAEISEPRVHEELQSGYLLHERLLRPSMVKVAVPQADQPAASESEESEEPETD